MQLLLLFSFLLFSFALGSPSDILYIEKLNADEAQLLDAKDFAGLANIFSKDVIYNAGAPLPNLYGIDSTIAGIAKVVGTEVIQQNSITTQSITLLPPFDEHGAAGTATGVVYLRLADIGQGNLTGQAVIVFAKYKDKYVKTGNFSHYGGWRISERFFIAIGEPVGNRNILPALRQN